MGRLTLNFLKMSHFRTHKSSIIESSGKSIVIVGSNGVGKTNILEAISLLSPGRGFRRATFEQISRRPDLVGWKVSAEIEILGNTHEISTWWDNSSSRKITIDGKFTNQIELGRLVRVLWITPLMDRIWLDGSIDRRRFLDRVVSTLISDHIENNIKYYNALKQRNRLIKDRIFDANWYTALEHQMAVSGFEIDASRREVLSRIMNMQESSHSAFPMAKLNLIGSVFNNSEEFEKALKNGRQKDIFAGRTLIGPHLSDLSAIYSSKGIEAKSCSTGEQKALLISIIIASAKLQLEEFSSPPILLFDEISAHLDGNRRSLLYDELRNLGAQVFLTGTDIEIFNELKNQVDFVRVELDSEISVCKHLSNIFV